MHNSVSGALMPSHPHDIDTSILQCTLGNSQYQEFYWTWPSNPFHTTYKECRLWATSVLNEPTKTILLEEHRHVDFRNPYQIRTAITTQAHNIGSRCSVPIELMESWWMEMENIIRNIFPDIAKQLKLPDRNAFSEISPVPVAALTNQLQPFPLI